MLGTPTQLLLSCFLIRALYPSNCSIMLVPNLLVAGGEVVYHVQIVIALQGKERVESMHKSCSSPGVSQPHFSPPTLFLPLALPPLPPHSASSLTARIALYSYPLLCALTHLGDHLGQRRLGARLLQKGVPGSRVLPQRKELLLELDAKGNHDTSAVLLDPPAV